MLQAPSQHSINGQSTNSERKMNVQKKTSQIVQCSDHSHRLAQSCPESTTDHNKLEIKSLYREKVMRKESEDRISVCVEKEKKRERAQEYKEADSGGRRQRENSRN